MPDVYGALWRALPGPWIVKLVLLAAALYALVEWVFPYVNTLVPAPDVTVEQP